jgi:DegV family protein with EDD domain
MPVRIVTDSTADLPPELAKKLNIKVVPLNVHFDMDTYKDGIDLTSAEFFKKLVAAPKLPTTSQPSVGEFLEAYKALAASGDPVVSIHISEKLSGTMNSARQARDALGSAGRVEVIDSLVCSIALGVIVLEAAEAANADADLQTVIARTRDAVFKCKLIATLDTLEYLAKGGRIGKAQSFLGGLLQVKPIIQVKEVVEPVERVRTRQKAIERLLELVKELGPAKRLAVLHADAADDAARIARELRSLLPEGQEPVVSWIGPVIGTYAGPKAVGVGVIPRG